ncbi:MAG: carotenoid oxygenase family protein [Cyanophyceae cyanobacterium]
MPPFLPPALPWAKALAYPALEFGPLQLPILSGALPPSLQGSLYRNGPGRLERGGQQVGHWFDGDGAVLRIHFGSQNSQQSQATGLYRFVKTHGYQVESQQDRFLYGGYGMTPPGPLWQRWGRMVKNAANTSVLALNDRLLALWEAGSPHQLDLETLDTVGLADLGGTLPEGQPYSAHPKRDPHTGEIFNFGVQIGRRTLLKLYVSDPQGHIQRQATIPLTGIPLIHDCVLAGSYWVFCIPPVRLNLWPVAAGWQSYSDSLQWKPHLGTEILIVDRQSLEVVARRETDPWFQWHFANGFVDQQGDICIDVVKYGDFATNDYLAQVPSGITSTHAPGYLNRLRLDAATAKVLSVDPLIPHPCEFPTLAAAEVGHPHQSLYVLTHRPGADGVRDLFGAIGCLDLSAGDPRRQSFVLRDLGPNRYPSEPIFAPDPSQPGQGWLLTIVFDGNCNSSEVWIFAAHQLQEDPVCRLGLPSVVPHSFHGTWCPSPNH